jgi:hypothetical protein
MCRKQASLRIRLRSGAAVDTTAPLRHLQFARFVGGDVGRTQVTTVSRQGKRGSLQVACRKDNQSKISFLRTLGDSARLASTAQTQRHARNLQVMPGKRTP